MNLAQLRNSVEAAFECAIECENDPSRIPVTLEFHRFDNDAITSDDQVEVHYDNNCTASGCVITAWLDDSKQPTKDQSKIPATVTIETVRYQFEKIGNGWLTTCPGGTRIFSEDIDAMMRLLTAPLRESVRDHLHSEWDRKFEVVIGSNLTDHARRAAE